MSRIGGRRNNNQELVIDNVLSTQPELGPTIPEGGWGWVVFFISLFFQTLIPSLIVSFGMFLVFSRVPSIAGNNPKLWDNKLLHVPLFFIASWTFFDPTSRKLIAQSTWPKLFATGGTCLTCAGLLFVWMGMTGAGQSWLFVLAGFVSGIGASIQMSQCEILLSQYFRLKLPILIHIGHAAAAMGFIVSPIIVGHNILTTSLSHVILWYQALILQGLILNLLIRKPLYLKSKSIDRYNYISTNPDDEEDIFSKNSRELQIKVQNRHGTQIERHEIPSNTQNTSTATEPSTSSDVVANGSTNIGIPEPKNWVSFEEGSEDGETPKYEKVQPWERFDEEEKTEDFYKGGDPLSEQITTNNTKKWETFEDDPLSSADSKERSDSATRNNKNLHLEMSFGNVNEPTDRPATRSISGLPIPLFSDNTPVNNNNTYSYDILEDQTEPHSSVFMPTTTAVNPTVSDFSKTTWELLQQPTFYKSLVTVINTKWSVFVFFALYPSFLYQEVNPLPMKKLSNLVGTISMATMIFAAAAYFINVEKKWRPKVLWCLCWIGALGYFMISDWFTESVLLFGGVQIVSSIAALQHVGTPLLGLTVKGEATKEYTLISVMTGLSFLLFLVINASFKEIFRLMALLNFFTGSLWLANYIYKRLRIR